MIRKILIIMLLSFAGCAKSVTPTDILILAEAHNILEGRIAAIEKKFPTPAATATPTIAPRVVVQK